MSHETYGRVDYLADLPMVVGVNLLLGTRWEANPLRLVDESQ